MPGANANDRDLSIAEWNEEDAADAAATTPKKTDPRSLVVFSRDWTVETIIRQIDSGNIDLDPDFQRRNAWKDERRSALIESFILNFPVPQIVLAENPNKPKSFIVIDGKQRLMTIAGFFLPEYRNYWNNAELSRLKLLTDLNGVAIEAFLENPAFVNERRQLLNADIRTSVISAFKGDDVLYDIFYRLNTGSVPLSSQELRQVLHRGPFSQFLLSVTDVKNPLWRTLGQDGPDARLRDVELLLRIIALDWFGATYTGNMKPFLDHVMGELNKTWKAKQAQIKTLVENIFLAVVAAEKIYGDRLGRKYKNGKFENTLNRSLFEVQVYYLQDPKIRLKSVAERKNLGAEFQALCDKNSGFMASVESTTKSIENYTIRFSEYSNAVKKVVKMKMPPIPISGHQ
jgi:hypothetical protein